MLVGRAAAVVREERVNAEWAVQRALDELAAVFDDVDDPYLHERKGDLHDVAGRLRINLREEKGRAARSAAGSRHAVRAHRRRAHAVGRRAARLDPHPRLCHRRRQPHLPHRHSRAVPRRSGGRRPARRQPAAAAGRVGHRRRRDRRRHHRSDARPVSGRRDSRRAGAECTWPSSPSATVRSRPSDGVRVVLQANIERSDDVAAALDAGAEGIGLYRSEFMLVGGPPDMAAEDEQYHVYRQLWSAWRRAR